MSAGITEYVNYIIWLYIYYMNIYILYELNHDNGLSKEVNKG